MAVYMHRCFQLGLALLAVFSVAPEDVFGGETSAVLATVNGVAITDDDVISVLKITRKYNPDFQIDERAKKEALERLIDTLLMEARLDLADPALTKELDLARKNALRAYFVSEKMEKARPPTLEELDRFVKEHPNLFAERKAWHYVDLAFAKDPKVDIHVIKAMALVSNQKKYAPGSSPPSPSRLDPAIGYLNSISENFTLFRGFRNSEQISPGILKMLEASTAGEITVDDESDPGFNHVLLLISVEPEPVDAKAVRGAVFKGIVLEREGAILTKTIGDLRSHANVTYLAGQRDQKHRE